MKKILVLMLCFMLFLGLCSCDTEDLSGGDNQTITEVSDDQSSKGNKSNSSKSKLSEKELAMQAYDAVLKNEIPMLYETGEELYLKDVFSFEQDELPVQTVVDMDQDGIDEIITDVSSGKIRFLLHYESGRVYGFSFSYDSMSTIYTDGSFYWYYYGYLYERGCSRISFEGEKLKFEEIYRVLDFDRFYIGGKQVTPDEFYEYRENNPQTEVEFVPMDISLWEQGKAIALASEYWGVTEGSFDEETGYRYHLTYSKNYYDNTYEVCLYWFVENSYYEHLEHVWVDVSTGEVAISNELHGKG